MSRYATFGVIAAMILGLVFLLVARDRPRHEAPAEALEATGAVDAGPGAAPPADAGVAAANEGGAGAPSRERTLRVASLGWELIAAGAAIVPSTGQLPAPLAPIELAPERSLEAIEARLARGGADPEGADLALVPLPAFVASFDRLRALEPRAFLVVGFSRGREEVRTQPGVLLRPPPADEVKMVAFGPPAVDAAAREVGSEAATLLGLFALDLAGVAPPRVRFVSPGAPEAKAAPVAALVKGAADDRKVAFSTADASRLVPIVAVASKSVIEGREPAIREWSKAWLDGLSRARKDIPGVARRLAAKEALPLSPGIAGAPEALVLVERLGQIENATLEEQSSLIGPLAKRGVTLETLTQRTWQLARGGGLAANAAPPLLPIDARVVAAIAPPPKELAPGGPPESDAGAAFGPIPAGAVPLLAYRAENGDAESVAAQIELLAGIFERGYFRITARGGEKAARAIANAARQKGIDAPRLGVTAGEPQGAFASVEILAPP